MVRPSSVRADALGIVCCCLCRGCCGISSDILLQLALLDQRFLQQHLLLCTIDDGPICRTSSCACVICGLLSTTRAVALLLGCCLLLLACNIACCSHLCCF